MDQIPPLVAIALQILLGNFKLLFYILVCYVYTVIDDNLFYLAVILGSAKSFRRGE